MSRMHLTYIYIDNLRSVCPSIRRSCSPLLAVQTWQVRYQMTAHSPGKSSLASKGHIITYNVMTMLLFHFCSSYKEIHLNLSNLEIHRIISHASKIQMDHYCFMKNLYLFAHKYIYNRSHIGRYCE